MFYLFPSHQSLITALSISIPQTPKVLAIPAPLAPLAPGVGDVLVKVESIGLNPAQNIVWTDLGSYVLHGYTDSAGAIVKLGEGVTGWEVGNRVYTTDEELFAFVLEQVARPTSRKMT